MGESRPIAPAKAPNDSEQNQLEGGITQIKMPNHPIVTAHLPRGNQTRKAQDQENMKQPRG